ncbi:hypothetical protein CDA63_13530 [Hymenobacter amundsenii]|uniref:Putative auto-transporter adhesin head GIN domain-containing protein n=1 Tax=Hymenobacter amundsenii TaxID=2006685 RepID=A0A2D0AFJ9_9BACT|nr:head GIN domain-containing protein [Hymenobacter amundsenii]OWP62525.1 hypothetical protein CDA63_13530 [Hymenobacter amundsenii]
MKNLTTLALLWLLALVPALAQTATEPRSVASFTAIEVSNGIELNLTAGPAQRIQASADTPELLARLKTDVRNGVLVVSFEREKDEKQDRNRRTFHLLVEVTAPAVAGLKGTSGAKIALAGPYVTDKLNLDLSSGAMLEGEIRAAAFSADLSSGGIATPTGQAQRLTVDVSSGGIFKGQNLQATTCDASASSGGIANVEVRETLTAQASSGGLVRYGGVAQVKKRASSGGSVKSR